MGTLSQPKEENGRIKTKMDWINNKIVEGIPIIIELMPIVNNMY